MVPVVQSPGETKVQQEQQRFDRGVWFGLVQYGVSILTGVGYWVLSARLVGAEAIGAVALLGSILGVFRPFTSLGEGLAMTAALNQAQRNSQQTMQLFIKAGALSVLLNALLCVGCGVGALWALHQVYGLPQQSWLLCAYAVGFWVLFHWLCLLEAPYVAFQQMHYGAWAELAGGLSRIGLLALGFLWAGPSPWTLVLAHMGAMAVNGAWLVLCLPRLAVRHWGGSVTFSIRNNVSGRLKTDLQSLYRFSLKAWPASLSTSALQHADRLILGYFVSPAHLGIYTLVYSLFERLLMVGTQYEDMMVASASRNRDEEGKRVLRILYGRALQAALFWILPGVMVGCLYAGVGLSIFGETFVGGSQALIILLMGLPFDAMARISLGGMAGMNRPGVRTVLIVFGALVNVGLNLLWIPAYGIVGAAWANTLAILLTGVLCGWWLMQGVLAGGNDWRSLRQVLGSALGLCVGLVCIKTLLAPWLWLQLVFTLVCVGAYYRWGRQGIKI